MRWFTTMALAFVAASVWAGGASERQSLTIPANDGITTVNVSIFAGDVTVGRSGSADGRAELSISESLLDELDLVLESRREGDTLVLDVHPRTPTTSYSISPFEHVRLSLDLPDGFEVTINSGAGDVDVRGFNGTLAADLGAGSIELGDVRGRITARTGAGSIRGRSIRLTASSSFATGLGSVNLDIASGREHLASANSGLGRVQVR